MEMVEVYVGLDYHSDTSRVCVMTLDGEELLNRSMLSDEHEPIRRDYLPEDLAPLIAGAGVNKTVFVQTQHNVEENRWALGLADEHDFIAGVVGWVDLAGPECEQQLLEFIEPCIQTT